MSINFEKNAYYHSSKFNNESDDNFKKTITLKYKHDEDDTIKKFQTNYSPDGWFLRKIVAIPLAVGGVIKTIFHLVQALIASINPFSSDKSYSKSRLFYVRRDIQEVKGWVISLFDDMKGQFHIQESQFHKTCYDCALENEKKSKNEVSNKNDELKQPQTDEDWLELAREQLKKNSPDEALKAINKINTNSNDKEDLLKKIANQYFDNEKYTLALNVITKIQMDINSKDKLLIKLANAFIDSNKYDLAYFATKKITNNTEKKNELLSTIAEHFKHEKNYSQALKVIKDVQDGNRSYQTMLYNIATDLINQKEYGKALGIIKDITDGKEKNNLFNKIINEYLVKDKYDLSFEAFSTIYPEISKNQYFYNVAKQYLEIAKDSKDDINKINNLDKAYNIAKEIKSDINQELLDWLYIDLATEYTNSEQYEKALNALKKPRNIIQKMETLLFKIAETYKNKQQMDLAFEVIQRVTINTKTKAEFIIELAKHHHENEEVPKVLGLLNELVKDISLDIIRKNNIISIKELGQKCNIDIFFKHLSRISYENAKHLFDKKSESKDIFDNINLTLNKILPDKLIKIKSLNTKKESSDLQKLDIESIN